MIYVSDDHKVPWTLSRSVGSGGVTVAAITSRGHRSVHEPLLSTDARGIWRRQRDLPTERWINADAERERYGAQQSGIRTWHTLCIGKNIGLMEVSKVVPLLFYRYK
ncbi:hypothetical protein B0H10DRAFT_579310 [Mycena sp. CBHHK59/15]|nr:hypothetical protein B0H10DRAFT_579310 [Mycena sp. CBHHK59/15]